MSQVDENTSKVLNELKLEKEKLDAQKAKLDAEKAVADAQTQSTLAKFIGDVKAGPYSGSVDMKEKAGTEEALLLAARAVKECAAKVAEAVQSKATKFYIFGVGEFPKFQRLLTFRFRKELIKNAFTAEGITAAAPAASVAAPVLVSAGLEAFSKILGFFKSDYTIGGIEAKLDETLLLFSVAGKLQGEVHLPLIYQPLAQGSTVEALTSELAQLVNLRSLAAAKARLMSNELSAVEKSANHPANAATKDQLLANAVALKAKLDQLNGVIALYDNFASALTTPDANGVVPLTEVAQEFPIDAGLKQGGAVLLLRLENSGGGYLLKKNLLTGLGQMPLYHMGGATVTYLLLSGREGKVLAADVIPVYGGFVRTDQLRAELQR